MSQDIRNQAFEDGVSMHLIRTRLSKSHVHFVVESDNRDAVQRLFSDINKISQGGANLTSAGINVSTGKNTHTISM